MNAAEMDELIGRLRNTLLADVHAAISQALSERFDVPVLTQETMGSIWDQLSIPPQLGDLNVGSAGLNVDSTRFEMRITTSDGTGPTPDQREALLPNPSFTPDTNWRYPQGDFTAGRRVYEVLLPEGLRNILGMTVEINRETMRYETEFRIKGPSCATPEIPPELLRQLDNEIVWAFARVFQLRKPNASPDREMLIFREEKEPV